MTTESTQRVRRSERVQWLENQLEAEFSQEEIYAVGSRVRAAIPAQSVVVDESGEQVSHYHYALEITLEALRAKHGTGDETRRWRVLASHAERDGELEPVG